MRRWLALAALCTSIGAGAAPFTLTEGFDAVVPAGWTAVNNSAPPPGTNWFQGNPGVFNAHAGAANSYAAANFLSTGSPGGLVSNWLISPELSFAGQLLSFFARTETNSAFGDSLRVWISDAGASTDVADFDQLLVAINPGNQAGGFPDDWTEFTANLLAAGSGRIAFEYFAESALLANFIGVDSVNVTRVAVDEPGVLLLVALALGAAGMSRRGKVLGAALLAALALPVAAQVPELPAGPGGLMSFPHVRIVHSPHLAQTPAPESAQGFMAFVDPETGRLVEPSVEDVAELTAARQAETRLPAGATMMQARRFRVGRGWGVRLDPSHMSYSVVRKADDGRLVEACVVGETTAQRLIDLGGPVAISLKGDAQ